MSEYIGDKNNTTYEELFELLTQWVNKGKLEKYMEERYQKWIIFNHGEWAEVFIGDDEIDTYQEEDKGYEDAYYIMQEFLDDSKIKLVDDGNEYGAWATDRMLEGTLMVHPLSDMIELNKLEIEFDNNGKPLYVAADNETVKEIEKLK